MLERRASSYIDRSLTAHLYISSRLSHILPSSSFHFFIYMPGPMKELCLSIPYYSFRPMTRLSRDDRLPHPNHSDECLTRFGLKAFFSNLIHLFRASDFAPLPGTPAFHGICYQIIERRNGQADCRSHKKQW